MKEYVSKILGLAGAALIFLGASFKIYHKPYYTVMFIAGAVLLLSAYIVQSRQE